MAIVGLGTDIVEIARLAKVIARQGHAFAERVLTPTEFEAYLASNFPATFLAKRFAAKEAAAKALGTGIACGVTFQDFEITHDTRGKPLLHFSGQAQSLSAELNINNILLSISDEKHYAVATVVLEG